MKILIVSYYELKDALLCIAQALRDIGHIVTNYPLFQMAYDVHCRRPDYADHFADCIAAEMPDVVLWWFTNIPAIVIESLRRNCLQMCWLWFNWDDPWMWFNKEMEVEKKCPFFDCVIATSSAMLDRYVACGAKRAIFATPGFDPDVHHPIAATEKKYDISICCTNLYDNGTFTDQFIPRKQLIDDLVRCPDINFALFGPQHLRATYPNHYQGHVSYAQTNDVFNASRIVLCSHVCHSYAQYVNERTVLALGAGGLLLVDDVKELDTVIPRDCYVLLDRVNYVEQIRGMLTEDNTDHEKYGNIAQNGHRWALANATWACVAQKIHEQIVTHFFDAAFYRTQLIESATANQLSDEQLLQHCLNEKHMRFCAPPTTKLHSRRSESTTPLKIDFESWCHVNALLSRSCQTAETLLELQQIIDSNCNLDVNRVLAAHFAMQDQFEA